MTNSIIDGICSSCSCSRRQAEEYLNDEIRNLRDLSSLDDLRFGDLETACENLGLDHDRVEYFIDALS